MYDVIRLYRFVDLLGLEQMIENVLDLISVLRPDVAQGQTRVTVNVTGCGFESQSIKFNIKIFYFRSV